MRSPQEINVKKSGKNIAARYNQEADLLISFIRSALHPGGFI
jgi:hypothetical protein